MISPEQANISQAAEQMQFAADFNRNLDDREKREAATKLDDLVGSTLEKFKDRVCRLTRPSVEENIDEYLSLLLRVSQEDGSYINIGVKSALSVDGTRSRKIYVWESRSNRGGEYHLYYIEGNQVLRFDKDFSKPKTPQIVLDNNKPSAYRRLTVQEEEKMGVNRQPVGADEIDKLAELLESAEPDKSF